MAFLGYIFKLTLETILELRETYMGTAYNI